MADKENKDEKGQKLKLSEMSALIEDAIGDDQDLKKLAEKLKKKREQK